MADVMAVLRRLATEADEDGARRVNDPDWPRTDWAGGRWEGHVTEELAANWCALSPDARLALFLWARDRDAASDAMAEWDTLG
jgi:non-ribosomal peptide synthetase component F